jgi:hypothetical protein
MLRREDANIDRPRHARQATHQIPSHETLNKGKVDQADKRPERPTTPDQTPEIPLDLLRYERGIHAAQVNARLAREQQSQAGKRGGRRSRDLGRRHGQLDAVHEGEEQKGVDGCAEGLVERRLDQRVAHV